MAEEPEELLALAEDTDDDEPPEVTGGPPEGETPPELEPEEIPGTEDPGDRDLDELLFIGGEEEPEGGPGDADFDELLLADVVIDRPKFEPPPVDDFWNDLAPADKDPSPKPDEPTGGVRRITREQFEGLEEVPDRPPPGEAPPPIEGKPKPTRLELEGERPGELKSWWVGIDRGWYNLRSGQAASNLDGLFDKVAWVSNYIESEKELMEIIGGGLYDEDGNIKISDEDWRKALRIYYVAKTDEGKRMAQPPARKHQSPDDWDERKTQWIETEPGSVDRALLDFDIFTNSPQWKEWVRRGGVHEAYVKYVDMANDRFYGSMPYAEKEFNEMLQKGSASTFDHWRKRREDWKASIQENVKVLAENQALVQHLQGYHSQGYEDFISNPGFWTFVNNPVEILGQVAAENAPQMGYSIVATAIGALVAGPWGAIGAAGRSSFQMEYGAHMVSSMIEHGFDPTSEEGVRGFFQYMLDNPEIYAQVRTEGEAAGLIVGGFDAATMGVAGKLFREPIQQFARAGYRKSAAMARVSTEALVQSIGGGGGEAVKQIYLDGKVTDGLAIFQEIIAELGTAPAEAGINIYQATDTAKYRKYEADYKKQLQVLRDDYAARLDEVDSEGNAVLVRDEESLETLRHLDEALANPKEGFKQALAEARFRQEIDNRPADERTKALIAKLEADEVQDAASYIKSRADSMPADENPKGERLTVDQVEAAIESRLAEMKGGAPTVVIFDDAAGILKGPQERLLAAQQAMEQDPSPETVEAMAVAQREFGDALTVAKGIAQNIKPKSEGGPGMRVEGVQFNGKVYLHANHLTSAERAVEVFDHEVIGHDSVENVLGEKKTQNRFYARVVSQILADPANAEKLNTLANEYLDANDLQAWDQQQDGPEATATERLESVSPAGQIMLAKEFVAQLAEDPSMLTPIKRRRLVDWVKKTILRKSPETMRDKLTDAQVLQALHLASQHPRTGLARSIAAEVIRLNEQHVKEARADSTRDPGERPPAVGPVETADPLPPVDPAADPEAPAVEEVSGPQFSKSRGDTLAEDGRRLAAHGLERIESVPNGEYEIYLTHGKEELYPDDLRYQVAVQRNGLSAAREEDQLGRTDWTAVLQTDMNFRDMMSNFVDAVQGWANDKGRVAISSMDPAKTRQYHRLLTLAGLKPGEMKSFQGHPYFMVTRVEAVQYSKKRAEDWDATDVRLEQREALAIERGGMRDNILDRVLPMMEARGQKKFTRQQFEKALSAPGMAGAQAQANWVDLDEFWDQRDEGPATIEEIHQWVYAKSRIIQPRVLDQVSGLINSWEIVDHVNGDILEATSDGYVYAEVKEEVAALNRDWVAAEVEKIVGAHELKVAQAIEARVQTLQNRFDEGVGEFHGMSVEAKAEVDLEAMARKQGEEEGWGQELDILSDEMLGRVADLEDEAPYAINPTRAANEAGYQYHRITEPGGLNYQETLYYDPDGAWYGWHFDDTNADMDGVLFHTRSNTRTSLEDDARTYYGEEFQSDEAKKLRDENLHVLIPSDRAALRDAPTVYHKGDEPFSTPDKDFKGFFWVVREGSDETKAGAVSLYFKDEGAKSGRRMSGVEKVYWPQGKASELGPAEMARQRADPEAFAREQVASLKDWTISQAFEKVHPFMDKNWVEKALRLEMRRAILAGHEKFAWTTGDIQNRRYNKGITGDVVALRVMESDAYDGVFNLAYVAYDRDRDGRLVRREPTAISVDVNEAHQNKFVKSLGDGDAAKGREIIRAWHKQSVSEEASVLGLFGSDTLTAQDRKDLGADADRVILTAEGFGNGERIRIGGERNINFYDGEMRRYVEKILKKAGVKVKLEKFSGGRRKHWKSDLPPPPGQAATAEVDYVEGWSVDLRDPKVRAILLPEKAEDGVPMFSKKEAAEGELVVAEDGPLEKLVLEHLGLKDNLIDGVLVDMPARFSKEQLQAKIKNTSGAAAYADAIGLADKLPEGTLDKSQVQDLVLQISPRFRVNERGNSARGDDPTPLYGTDSNYNVTEPGGTNYREILVTYDLKPTIDGWLVSNADRVGNNLPDKEFATKEEANDWRIEQARDHSNFYGPPIPLDARGNHLDVDPNTGSPRGSAQKHLSFHTDHFPDRNVLFHLRVDERMMDGKRTLLIQEIQSDWHKAAQQVRRRHIYAEAQKAVQAEFEAANPAPGGLEENTAEMMTWRLNRREFVRNNHDKHVARLEKETPFDFGYGRKTPTVQTGTGQENVVVLVPDAPFKKTWHALAMKQAIVMAKREGFERVAWLDGAEQNERYNKGRLSEEIYFQAIQEGPPLPPGETQTKAPMWVVLSKQDVVSKKVGEKLTESEARKKVGDAVFKRMQAALADKSKFVPIGDEPYHSLTAEDLGVDAIQLGGHANLQFYDRDLRNRTNALIKKSGQKVTRGILVYEEPEMNLLQDPFEEQEDATELGVHYFDLTPEAAAATMNMPLFSKKSEEGVPGEGAGASGREKQLAKDKADKLVDVQGGEVKEIKGRVVGAPTRFNTPRLRTQLISRLQGMAERGEVGRMWYEHSSRAIMDLVAGDVNDADKLAQLIGVFSPQNRVQTNWDYALKAYNMWKSGMTQEEFLAKDESGKFIHMIKDGRGQLDAADALWGDVGWEGRKTNNFYQNLMVVIDPARAQGVTADMWIARAYGYPSDTLSDNAYDYILRTHREIGDQMGWEPWQVQAAVWTYAQGLWGSMKKEVLEAAEKKGIPLRALTQPRPAKQRDVDAGDATELGEMIGGGTDKANPEFEKFYRTMFQRRLNKELKLEGTEGAFRPTDKFDFSDAMERRLFFHSMEMQPGSTTNVLPHVHDMPYELKHRFFADMLESLHDPDTGNDIIAEELGMLPLQGAAEGAAVGPSIWINTAHGQLEITPAAQVGLATTTAKGGEGSLTMQDQSREYAEAYVLLHALYYRQDSGAGYRPFFAGKLADADGIDFVITDKESGETRQPNMTEVRAVHAALEKHFGDTGRHKDIGYYLTHDGFRLMNFMTEKEGATGADALDNLEFQKIRSVIAKSVLDLEGPEINVNVKKFAKESIYEGNDWRENGQGEVYRRRLRELGRSDVLRRLDSRLEPRIRKVYEKWDQVEVSSYLRGTVEDLPGGALHGPAAERAEAPVDFESPPDYSLKFSQSRLPGGTDREPILGTGSFPVRVLEDATIPDEVKDKVKTTYEIRANEQTLAEAMTIFHGEDPEARFRSGADMTPEVRAMLGQILVRRASANVVLAKSLGRLDLVNERADKAAELADRLSELSQSYGRAVQIFSAFSYLDPHSLQRLAKRQVAKAQGASLRRAGATDAADSVASVMQSAQQAASAGVAKERPGVDTLTRVMRNRRGEGRVYGRAKSPEAVARIMQMVRAGFKDHPEVRGKVLNAFTDRLVKHAKGKLEDAGVEAPARAPGTPPPTDREVLEDLLSRPDEYLETWGEVGEAIAEEYKDNPEKLRAIAEVYGAIQFDEASGKVLVGAISEELVDMEKQLDSLVREHYSLQNATGAKLRDRLVARLGLDPNSAGQLAKRIEDSYRGLLKTEAKRQLDQIAGRSSKKVQRAIKTQEQKLLEMANLGAFDREDVYNQIAKGLGLPTSYDPAWLKLIGTLADRVQEAGEGSPKDNATVDLLNEIANKVGDNPVDVMFAIRYANMLSGFRTHQINVFSNIQMVMLGFVTQAVRSKGSPTGMLHLLAGMARGFGVGGREAWHTYWTGRGRKGPEQSKYHADSLLDRWKPTGLLYPLRALKMLSTRPLAAMDAMFRYTNMEMKARFLAVQLAKKQGLKGKELKARVKEILALDGKHQQQAQDQAAAEGLEGDAYKRRVAELTEMARNPELQKDAMDFALNAVFQQKPDGLIGLLANSFNHMVNPPLAPGEKMGPTQWVGSKVGKVFVPFVNVVANVANTAIELTPGLGTLRWASQKYLPETDSAGKPTKSEEQLNDMLARNMIGTATIVTLQWLFSQYEDDDDPLWSITGKGPDNFDDAQTLKDTTDWEPWTIKTPWGRWNYGESPLAIPLAALGGYADQRKYGDMDEQELNDRLAAGFLAAGSTLFDQTFLSGVGDLIKVFKFDDQSGRAFDKLSKRTAASFAIPSAVSQTAQLFDSTAYTPNELNGAWINVINYGYLGEKYPRLNVWGEPAMKMEGTFSERFFDRLRKASGDPDPLMDFLVNHRMIPKPPSRDKEIFHDILEEKGQRAMEEAHYLYSRYMGQEFRSDLEARMSELEELSEEGKTDIVKAIVESMREGAAAKAEARLYTLLQRPGDNAITLEVEAFAKAYRKNRAAFVESRKTEVTAEDVESEEHRKKWKWSIPDSRWEPSEGDKIPAGPPMLQEDFERLKPPEPPRKPFKPIKID